jgi:RNA recognition motif. (a.k.a. RRM, RBD, or RNP domain)
MSMFGIIVVNKDREVLELATGIDVTEALVVAVVVDVAGQPAGLFPTTILLQIKPSDITTAAILPVPLIVQLALAGASLLITKRRHLIIKNIAAFVTSEQLTELFSRAGATVTKVAIDRDSRMLQSSGRGYVSMSCDTEALDVIRAYQGYWLHGSAIKIGLLYEEEQVHVAVVGVPPAFVAVLV